jgi:GntR family carbon starvation induced transcriptional regulator
MRRPKLIEGRHDDEALAEAPPRTLASEVLASIRNDILELKLAPGSKLGFDNLRGKYDVGFSPLREALSRLVVEGLVVNEDQRGFRVAPMTVEDFRDLTALRGEVEALAVAWSMERGDDGWEANLIAAFHRMSRAAESRADGDQNFPKEWAVRHKAFHEALVAACGSPRLLQMRRQLFDHFTRYHRVAPNHVWRNSIRDTEHKKLLDAALSRNVAKCTNLIRVHIRMREGIVEAVKALQAPA